MRHKVGALAILSLFVLSLAACGKSTTASPLAPTAATQSSSAAARISGSVSGASSGLASSSVAGAPAGLTVSVTGTSLTSSVDAAGRFTLTNVPPGSIELRFTGPGVDAKVQVGTVSPGDSLEIHITVTGAAAEIEDSVADHDGGREIEGRVEAVPPTTAAGTFKVAGVTITTNATTTFKLNGHTGLFSDIVVGARVHVKGQPSGTTAVVASEVNIQSLNQNPPTVPGGGNGNGGGDSDDDHGNSNQAEVSGVVTGLAGACPAIQFSVGTTKVVTNASTQFDLACSSVKNTVKVEVKGTRAADGTVTATRVKKD